MVILSILTLSGCLNSPNKDPYKAHWTTNVIKTIMMINPKLVREREQEELNWWQYLDC